MKLTPASKILLEEFETWELMDVPTEAPIFSNLTALARYSVDSPLNSTERKYDHGSF